MFQPVVPLSGFAGWSFLQRTRESQQEAFAESAQVKRATDDFRERIGSINTAEELVQDRQLLQVALGAYGLDDDINNKYLIQKVLEGGVIQPDALANRLSDPRYRALSEAFGFGDFSTPNTKLSTFPDETLERYEARQFEKAVGEQNNTLRLAMNVAPALADLLEGQSSEDGRWFSVMGNPPLRNVIETALGLPPSFGALDIDKQLVDFKQRTAATFGSESVDVFAEPEAQEKLVRLFLLRDQVGQATQLSSAQSALTLISSIPRLDSLSL